MGYLSVNILLAQAFFLTPAAKKNKSQGQNSSKKLKEKNQPLGGRSLPYEKLKKKTKTQEIFSSKLKISKGGSTFYTIFINKYFQKHKNIEKFAMILSKF